MLEGKNTVPVMKFSDNPEKTTNPGVKQVWRIWDNKGQALADLLGINNDEDPKAGQRCTFWHPSADYRHFNHNIEAAEALLKIRIENGLLSAELPKLDEVKAFACACLDRFDATYKRLLNPHIYKVSITENLRKLKLELIEKNLTRRQDRNNREEFYHES